MNQNPLSSSFGKDNFYIGQSDVQISKCFTKYNYTEGQEFQFRVTQIYDPTKFWIVTKFKELEIFQKLLFRYYYLNKTKYKVPEDDIQQEMYCISFIDGGYYRGVVAGIPMDIQEKQEYTVYFIDYGTVKTVEGSNIYYMDKKHAAVPHFVIRASLAGICPKGHQWTVEDVTEFFNLVSDKILIGVVINIDTNREILEIRCRENGNPDVIHEKLIEQKRARYFHETPEPSSPEGYLQPKEYLYLFPSHEALETGKVPQSVSDFNYMCQLSPESTVVGRYFQSNNPQTQKIHNN